MRLFRSESNSTHASGSWCRRLYEEGLGGTHSSTKLFCGRRISTLRVALGLIGRVLFGTVSSGAGGKSAKQINRGKKLNVIARTDRTGLHEILVGVLSESGAHEYIEHIMDIRLCLFIGNSLSLRKSPDQIRMTAVMLIRS